MSLIKKYCICFAGAVGTSKTPITHHLSMNLDLPVFNNDAIRSEVIEDKGIFDEVEHIKRRDARFEALIKTGKSFILDASVDREWNRVKNFLTEYEYKWFVISLDISKDLLSHLYKIKNYDETNKSIDKFIADHENFIIKNDTEINLHITDNTFPERLNISLESVKKWLKN